MALLKNMTGKGHRQHSSDSGKTYPTGLLQLNALRLTDAFSDDSNFRTYITAYFVRFSLLYNLLLVLFWKMLFMHCISNVVLVNIILMQILKAIWFPCN